MKLPTATEFQVPHQQKQQTESNLLLISFPGIPNRSVDTDTSRSTGDSQIGCQNQNFKSKY